MNWYDTFVNKFNFIRWADGDGRKLSDIQSPELYCLGVQSSATTNNLTETYANKNNFFRWVDLNGRYLSELSDIFCNHTERYLLEEDGNKIKLEGAGGFIKLEGSP